MECNLVLLDLEKFSRYASMLASMLIKIVYSSWQGRFESAICLIISLEILRKIGYLLVLPIITHLFPNLIGLAKVGKLINIYNSRMFFLIGVNEEANAFFKINLDNCILCISLLILLAIIYCPP